MSVLRDEAATKPCPVCAKTFEPEGRQRFCSTACRQSAWRRRRAAPFEPVVAPAEVVYECGACEARYLGERRCPDCNRWCARVGPGGPCPHCYEPVAIGDLLSPAQFARAPKGGRR